MKKYSKKEFDQKLDLKERIKIIEEQNEEVKKLKKENKALEEISKEFEKRVSKALNELKEQQYSSIVNLKNRLITILEYPKVTRKYKS